MRKLAIMFLTVAGLLSLGSAPVFAGGPGSKESLTVWATPDKDNNMVVNGSLTVAPGTHGLVKLHLVGINGSSRKGTPLTELVNVVQGQTVYQFSFNTKYDLDRFKDYRVVSDGGVESRTIDRDECGFRVPEAPSSSLLLLGALPILGLVIARLKGVRIPHPSWNAIG